MVLKALILVGGYGTRLRPLTFSLPKPLVPFANIPIVVHQIEALVRVGVKEIILAVNVQPQAMVEFLKDCEKKYNIKIHFSQEDVPMGTAGPIALARAHLEDGSNDPFFMFNSDVICEFPLEQMLAFHRQHRKEGTIMVTPVEDPTKYGVVIFKDNGEIEQFVEKPKVPVSNKINAGIYLFNKDIIKRIENRPTSIEREIFPAMATEKQLYSMVLPGYWMDIGQPKDYLRGLVMHLKTVEQKGVSATYKQQGVEIRGNVLIDPSAKIGKGSVIGPDVTIGANVVIGEGTRINHAAIFDNTKIKSYANIKKSIIGWDCTIGRWSRVDDSVLGKDVEVADEIFINGVQVCPHKGIKEDELSAKIIM